MTSIGEQARAHSAVAAAIKRGQLPNVKTLPCQDCGGVAAVYHHAEGYDKAHELSVIPLCDRCHHFQHHPDHERRSEQMRSRDMLPGLVPITLLGYHCKRCGHEWIPFRLTPAPNLCPKCKSRVWDTDVEMGRGRPRKEREVRW